MKENGKEDKDIPFGNPGGPIEPSGLFRDGIRLFLQECAEPEDYDIYGGMPIWCTLLVHRTNKVVIPLYILQEDVKNPPKTPFCDQCRSSGWCRMYHLLIPPDRMWHKPLNDGVLNIQTHLLHGLIHCGGTGHLICINGIEAGSKLLRGGEIMDLWDRICTILHARKNTVEDVSVAGIRGLVDGTIDSVVEALE